MDRYQNDGRRLFHKVDETDFPAEGTEGECAGCSHSALSRYLITCIVHQHQKSRTSVNLSTLLLLYSLVVDVFFKEFTLAAGSACIFRLFGLNRALEHWANAQRQKRDRACQTTTKLIRSLRADAPPIPIGCAQMKSGSSGTLEPFCVSCAVHKGLCGTWNRQKCEMPQH